MFINKFDYKLFKACVRYFLSIFSSNDSPFKTMRNVFYFIYKARSQDIQIFIIFSLLFHTLRIQKDKWNWNNL